MCLVGPRNSLVAFDVSIYHLPFPHLPLYSSGIDGCENWTSFLCYIETILLLPLFLITIHILISILIPHPAGPFKSQGICRYWVCYYTGCWMALVFDVLCTDHAHHVFVR